VADGGGDSAHVVPSVDESVGSDVVLEQFCCWCVGCGGVESPEALSGEVGESG